MLMQIYEMLQFDHNVEAVEHGSYFKNLKCWLQLSSGKRKKKKKAYASAQLMPKMFRYLIKQSFES